MPSRRLQEKRTCRITLNLLKYVTSFESGWKDKVKVNFGEINCEYVWETDLIGVLEQWRELVQMMLSLRVLLLQ